MDYRCFQMFVWETNLISADNLRFHIVNTEMGMPGKRLVWPFPGISGDACSYLWLWLEPQWLPSTYTSTIKHREENSSWTYFQFIVQTVQISCNLCFTLSISSIWFGHSVLSCLNWTWIRIYIGQVCSPDFIPMSHLHMPLDF